MATIDLLRRRIAMAQAKADEYEGADLGYVSNGIFTPCVLVASPLIDISEATAAGHEIEWNSRGVLGASSALDAQMQMTYTIGSSNTTRSRVFSEETKYFRFTSTIDGIDNAYVKDKTANVYLWKGKNV